MARLTVSEIMQQIAATVNQEAIAPSQTSTEWSLWLSFLNRSYQEWAEASDWENLRVIYWPSVTGSVVTLPANYKKMASPPIIYDGTLPYGTPYPEIKIEDVYNHSITDKFITTIGNEATGFLMQVYPSLQSGASVMLQYFSTPSTLTAGTNIPLIPDNQFLVDRTIAYIFEGRSDSRFQIEETKARSRLLNMVENANMAKYNSYAGGDAVTTPTQRVGFRIGRD